MFVDLHNKQYIPVYHNKIQFTQFTQRYTSGEIISCSLIKNVKN